MGGWFKHSLVTFLNSALPPLSEVHVSGLTETLSSIVAGLAFLLGLGLAYLFFIGKPEYAESLTRVSFVRRLHAFWFADWGFDWLYDRTLVRPFIWIATLNRRDVVDNAFTAIARWNQAAYYALSRTESGRLRWYAAAVGSGRSRLYRGDPVHMILAWLIIVLLGAGVLATVAARWSSALTRWISLAATLLDFCADRVPLDTTRRPRHPRRLQRLARTG